MRSRSILLGSAVGFTVAVVTILCGPTLSQHGPTRQVYTVLFYPEYPVYAVLADSLGLLGSDTGLRILLWAIHVLYCAVIGGLIGLGLSWMRGRSAKA